MTAFRYRAYDADSREIGGVIEADTGRQARDQLRERGCAPIEVTAVSGAAAVRGRLKPGELVFVTRQWATLLEAGLPLEQALNALIAQSENVRMREALAGVRAEVLAGHALASALARDPASFPPLYRYLVAAGEKSGDLARVLLRLADYLEARQALAARLLQASVYPAIVTLVAFAVIVGMMTYVVPQVVGVFQHGQRALPFLTRALMAASEATQTVGPWLVPILVGAVAIGLRALRQEALRRRLHRGLLRLPLLGSLLRSLDSSRFAYTLGVLVGSGVPLLAALETGRDVLRLLPLRDAVTAAIQDVREGALVARSLERGHQFPPLLLHLVASGEASGDLGVMFEKAARQMQFEVERRLALLVAFIEPALILFMGGIVLLIVLAVLQPIIEINHLLR